MVLKVLAGSDFDWGPCGTPNRAATAIRFCLIWARPVKGSRTGANISAKAAEIGRRDGGIRCQSSRRCRHSLSAPSSATPVEVPLNYRPRHQPAGALRQGAAAADRSGEPRRASPAALGCSATCARQRRRIACHAWRHREREQRRARRRRRRYGRSSRGRFALIGVQGIVRMALAGFDVACWDALAIAAGKPLCGLLGAEPKPIPAYNSCGLGLKDDLGVARRRGRGVDAAWLHRREAAARLSDDQAATSPPCARCASASVMSRC